MYIIIIVRNKHTTSLQVINLKNKTKKQQQQINLKKQVNNCTLYIIVHHIYIRSLWIYMYMMSYQLGKDGTCQP